MNSTLCFYLELILEYCYLSSNQYVPIMAHVIIRLLGSLAHTISGTMAP